MKTLDEAMDVISDKRGSQMATDEFQKFLPICREIVASERVAGFCGVALRQVLNSQPALDPNELAVKIWLDGFLNGVKIGMEMEK